MIIGNYDIMEVLYMKKVPSISSSEWKVMKIIWQRHPITANEIIDILEGETDWKPKTIKTLINRLKTKGVIGYSVEKRTYSYFPLFSEDECMQEENKSFLQRVYGGSLNLMLANFFKQENLTPDEIEELKKILNEKKSKDK